MVRWQPDARGRLEQAAVELYLERGFDRTTVVEIAERAGLTERTFFRYYADKREVLFGGAPLMQHALVAAVDEAPAGLAPMEVLARALGVAGEMFPPQSQAVVRQRVIDAHPDLQERELIKLARLAAALADALQRRGVEEPAAGLAAEAGIAVFKAAFTRWIRTSDTQDFADLIRRSLEELKAVTAG